MATTRKREVNLDKARAARAEAAGTPVVVKLGGETFELPAEIPADYSLLLAEGDVRGALTALLNGKVEAFFEQRPSVQDLNELIDNLERLYGSTAGE